MNTKEADKFLETIFGQNYNLHMKLSGIEKRYLASHFNDNPESKENVINRSETHQTLWVKWLLFNLEKEIDYSLFYKKYWVGDILDEMLKPYSVYFQFPLDKNRTYKLENIVYCYVNSSGQLFRSNRYDALFNELWNKRKFAITSISRNQSTFDIEFL